MGFSFITLNRWLLSPSHNFFVSIPFFKAFFSALLLSFPYFALINFLIDALEEPFGSFNSRIASITFAKYVLFDIASNVPTDFFLLRIRIDLVRLMELRRPHQTKTK